MLRINLTLMEGETLHELIGVELLPIMQIEFYGGILTSFMVRVSCLTREVQRLHVLHVTRFVFSTY